MKTQILSVIDALPDHLGYAEYIEARNKLAKALMMGSRADDTDPRAEDPLDTRDAVPMTEYGFMDDIIGEAPTRRSLTPALDQEYALNEELDRRRERRELTVRGQLPVAPTPVESDGLNPRDTRRYPGDEPQWTSVERIGDYLFEAPPKQRELVLAEVLEDSNAWRFKYDRDARNMAELLLKCRATVLTPPGLVANQFSYAHPIYPPLAGYTQAADDKYRVTAMVRRWVKTPELDAALLAIVKDQDDGLSGRSIVAASQAEAETISQLIALVKPPADEGSDGSKRKVSRLSRATKEFKIKPSLLTQEQRPINILFIAGAAPQPEFATGTRDPNAIAHVFNDLKATGRVDKIFIAARINSQRPEACIATQMVKIARDEGLTPVVLTDIEIGGETPEVAVSKLVDMLNVTDANLVLLTPDVKHNQIVRDAAAHLGMGVAVTHRMPGQNRTRTREAEAGWVDEGLYRIDEHLASQGIREIRYLGRMAQKHDPAGVAYNWSGLQLYAPATVFHKGEAYPSVIHGLTAAMLEDQPLPPSLADAVLAVQSARGIQMPLDPENPTEEQRALIAPALRQMRPHEANSVLMDAPSWNIEDTAEIATALTKLIRQRHSDHEARDLLLATGNVPLTNLVDREKFFMASYFHSVQDKPGEPVTGENILGRALETVRADLRAAITRDSTLLVRPGKAGLYGFRAAEDIDGERQPADVVFLPDGSDTPIVLLSGNTLDPMSPDIDRLVRRHEQAMDLTLKGLRRGAVLAAVEVGDIPHPRPQPSKRSVTGAVAILA